MTEKLPEDFILMMRRLLGEEEFLLYLESLERPPFRGLRVNTRKISPEDFCRMAEAEGIPLSPVPWEPCGFFIPESFPASHHPWYAAGLYYLQEPSAMAPAALLPVHPGDRVLDLCAAPGGKSTALASRLKGAGFLLANDISASRAKALLKNLEINGSGNILVSAETPERLREHFPGYFDKILVDAPCSGEGMFHRDNEVRKAYLEKGPESYIPVQRDILRAAAGMLSPGGYLLYSTCTFNEEENEGNIRFLLEEYPELSPVSVSLPKGLCPGFLPEGTGRIFPHLAPGEGHFLALLKKAGEAPSRGISGSVQAKSKRNLPEFFSGIRREFPENRLFSPDERLFLLPEELAGGAFSCFQGLRLLRSGLFLGEEKKKRFEPSQALAMHLSGTDYPHTISFSHDDERVSRYLRGETIPVSGEESGKIPEGAYVLVETDHFPLGWAKRQRNSLKNKYQPGWRIS